MQPASGLRCRLCWIGCGYPMLMGTSSCYLCMCEPITRMRNRGQNGRVECIVSGKAASTHMGVRVHGVMPNKRQGLGGGSVMVYRWPHNLQASGWPRGHSPGFSSMISWIEFETNSLNESSCCRTRPFSLKKEEITVQASSCIEEENTPSEKRDSDEGRRFRFVPA